MYSQEEAALLLRDKLIRLQSLYIEQFKRLQHVLKEKRRKFLHTYKQEREMLGEAAVVSVLMTFRFLSHRNPLCTHEVKPQNVSFPKAIDPPCFPFHAADFISV